jgi:hypothetical protein
MTSVKWSTYLWFALIPWAVPLVYENRIVDVIHDNVLKMYIRGKARRRIRPCFDSHTSHCVCKSAANNSNPRHRLFILVLTKTSYADSMARSTMYSLDKYIPTTVTERDTIITGGNVELITLILVERPMWIPSVLGLFSGALMVTWLNVRFWHPKTLMWNCLLLRDVMFRTIELVT